MTDSLQLRGLRGATTSSENTVAAIREAVNELVEALMEQNGLTDVKQLSEFRARADAELAAFAEAFGSEAGASEA